MKLINNFSFKIKIEIDRKDLRNKTPLELAIFLDRYECAKLLVEHGADCSIITKTGWNCKIEFFFSFKLFISMFLIMIFVVKKWFKNR
jgi:ankyrin repeat protein